MSSENALQSFKKKEKCDFCFKEFSNRQNKHRHMKRSCKVKKEQAIVKFEKSELKLNTKTKSRSPPQWPRRCDRPGKFRNALQACYGVTLGPDGPHGS